ncbi:MAG: alkaline phosphatase family protein, partial [Thermoanaerobaculia bacterium]|nr:alkaline phosphatase family protein [Thermoanaerobaculia bacterium]
MSRRPAAAAALLSTSLLAACAPRATPPEEGDGPRLVLLIVVDQLRADYLDRFGAQLTDGLARLMREGVRYTEAAHDHARTSTAPGYATLATGLVPRRHGIIANAWYDRRSGDFDYAVEADDDSDPSPRRLLGSTVGDWLRRARPGARVYSVAGKDRSAVMMGGHDADAAFWYDDEDGFETSAYYLRRDPGWLREFNDHLPEEGFAEPWSPLPVPAEELERMGIVEFDQGPLVGVFPHPVGGVELVPDRSYWGAVYYTPRLDELVARFALHLLRTHELGADATPDLLAVGFSAPDLVGHGFGPDSRELLDTVLRLDRTLGELLDAIDEAVGLDRTVVALSADHGVSDVPELRRERGLSGGRPGVEEILCLRRVESGLAARFGDGPWLRPGPFVNEWALERRGVERTEAEAEAERLIELCPSVAEVWTRTELSGDAPPEDAIARRYWNSFHPERSPDLSIQFVEHFVNSTALASHGTAYD